MGRPNPITSLLRSRKFLLLILDTVISSVLLLVGRYVAPDLAEIIVILIASWQAVFAAVIIGIAVEDAATKRATIGDV